MKNFLLSKTIKIIGNNKLDLFFENLVYFCISVYILTVFFASSVFVQIKYFFAIDHKIMWSTFFLLMIKIAYDFLSSKYTYLECAIYALLCIIGFFVKLTSGLGDLFLFFLYSVACLNVDKKKFISVSLFSLIATLLTIIIFGNLPFFTQSNALQVRYGATRLRYGLGFLFTTLGPNLFLGLSFLLILYFKKFRIAHYLIIFLINLIFFILTDTKSVFLCINLLLILTLISDIIKGNMLLNILGFANIFMFPLGAISIYILTILYKYDFWLIKKLNSAFSGRLSLGYSGIVNWGIHPFGFETNMSTEPGQYTYVDSSYINYLLNDGYFPLLIIICIFAFCSYIAYKKTDKKMIIYLFILSLHSILDPQLIIIAYNPLAALVLSYCIEYIKGKRCEMA